MLVLCVVSLVDRTDERPPPHLKVLGGFHGIDIGISKSTVQTRSMDFQVDGRSPDRNASARYRFVLCRNGTIYVLCST